MKKSERGEALRIAVVGAGFGGLSAAIGLAVRGHRVRVYEQASHAGGKAGSIEAGGYRFDTGPSLMTMRHVFSSLFSEAGRELEDYLEFIPLDPICRYFFDDGTRLKARGEPRDFADEVGAVIGENPAHITRFLAHSRRIYRRTAPLFLEHSLHSPSSFVDPKVLASIFRRGRLDINRTMDEANRSFFDDPRLVQLFDRYATYNGSSPYKVPGTLNIIPHVEYNMGAYAVSGGIFAVPSALRRLAEELGVEFLFDTRIEAIRLSEGASHGVEGVAFRGGFDPADIVVSDVDARRTYELLLDDGDAPYARRYRSLEPSSSGLVFFWGMKSDYPELGVNNIFFSGDYRREFYQLFDELICPDEPTVYVNITSKVTPEDAPAEGGENWFVLVNAPRNAGQNWEMETNRMRMAVLERIGKALGRVVKEDIAIERVLSPEDIEHQSGSTYGSLYGISSNTKRAAFLRHPSWTRRYPNLFFVGGSVHPGGGMPLAVLSGSIATDAIERRFGRAAESGE